MPAELPIPDELRPVLAALPTSLIVGGGVRDWVLGSEPKDLDVEVYGLHFDELVACLQKFGRVDLVGRSFAVAKLSLASGAIYDVSIARRESKLPNRAGHRAFKVESDPLLGPVEAAARRDFTINALAYDPREHRVLDFFDGLVDLENRVLRHTSAAFGEDPLRVLRAFQFASRLDARLHPDTAKLCRDLKDQFASLAPDRVGIEWTKWATRSIHPARGIEVLEETGWIDHFPALRALAGVPQDAAWHPEGDALVHTKHCCNALCRQDGWRELHAEDRLVLMLAILCHDFGKPACTRTEFVAREKRECIISPGHDVAGVEPTVAFLSQLRMPNRVIERVSRLVRQHMAHLTTNTDTDIRWLSTRLDPENIANLSRIVAADHGGRPPLPAGLPAQMERIAIVARALGIAHSPPPELVRGRDVVALGIAPGPAVGVLTRAAYDAQLNGVFGERAPGIAWLRAHAISVLRNARLIPTPLISGDDLIAAGLQPGPAFKGILGEVLEAQLFGGMDSLEQAINLLRRNGMKFGLSDPELARLGEHLVSADSASAAS